MKSYVVFINPECSKCKIVLKELEKYDRSISIRYYLEDPLSRDEAEKIIRLFGSRAIRNLDMDLTNEDMITLLLNDSSRLQRPLILGDDSGEICRPPEKLKDYLTSEN